jgi:RES domain-containing protein
VVESLGTQQQYGIAVDARLPLTLVAIDVSLQKLIDMTDDSVLHELDLTRQRLLRCRWRENMDKGHEALTQAIGRIAFEAGLEALFVPSAQVRKGKNLVVFLDNLQKASSLTIQNVGTSAAQFSPCSVTRWRERRSNAMTVQPLTMPTR